jgi:hypothetical protein
LDGEARHTPLCVSDFFLVTAPEDDTVSCK